MKPVTAYRAAVIQFDPLLNDKARNIARLVEMTEEAAANGAKLIVHPEMATTGYCFYDRAEIAPLVETVPGPTTELFQEIAKRHDCLIVLAIAEVVEATGIFYNSAVLVGPEGVIGRYRKTHPFIAEPKWAKDGDLGIPVFDTPLGRIAMVVCQDAVFPETSRVPAVLGADLICFPTNWLGDKSPSPTWLIRAWENGIWFLAANRWASERGVQFSGGSCIVDPDGMPVATIDSGDGIVYADIDLDRARATRTERLAGRRPELYDMLTLNSYHWLNRGFHDLYGHRPLPPGRTSTIAVVQTLPLPGALEDNLRTIESTVEASSADLLIFPELMLTGAVAQPVGAASRAESIPGPSTERLAALCQRTGQWLITGMIERDGERLFNSAVLIGPDGVIGIHRKLHPCPVDRRWATPGDLGLRTHDTPIGRIGILIGEDGWYPEASSCLAIAGADLIACPSMVDGPAVTPMGATAIPLPPWINRNPTPAHRHLWRERFKETTTMVAVANAGGEWLGWSGIFASDANDQSIEATVPGSAPGIATATLDTTGASGASGRYVTNPLRAKENIMMRVPIWYDALQTPIANLPAMSDVPIRPGGDPKPA